MRLQLLEAGYAGRKNSSRDCHCTFGVPAAASSMASSQSPTVEPPEAWSTEHGELGMIHLRCDRSLLAAGCWLRRFRGSGSVGGPRFLASEKSQVVCETCRVLGARLLDAPLHSRVFRGGEYLLLQPVKFTLSIVDSVPPPLSSRH